MTDERSSSSLLRNTISEPDTGIERATFWWPVRRLRVRSPVWGSNGHQKVAGSIPNLISPVIRRLRVQIVFLRIDLDDHSLIISRYPPSSHTSKNTNFNKEFPFVIRHRDLQPCQQLWLLIKVSFVYLLCSRYSLIVRFTSYFIVPVIT